MHVRAQGDDNLFAALDVASGRVIGKTYRRHRSKEFCSFLNEIERNVPDGLDGHLILDNLATHRTAKVHKWLLLHPRFKLHFTPTYSSWLNLVESIFSIIERRVTKRAVHGSVEHLEHDITKCLEVYNRNPSPFTWTKSADEIFDSLGRYCERASATRDPWIPGQLDRRQFLSSAMSSLALSEAQSSARHL